MSHLDLLIVFSLKNNCDCVVTIVGTANSLLYEFDVAIPNVQQENNGIDRTDWEIKAHNGHALSMIEAVNTSTLKTIYSKVSQGTDLVAIS